MSSPTEQPEGVCEHRKALDDRRVRPVQIFDRNKDRTSSAPVTNEIGQHIGLSLSPHSFVHGVKSRFEIQGLREIEEIVEEYPSFSARVRFVDGAIRGSHSAHFVCTGGQAP